MNEPLPVLSHCLEYAIPNRGYAATPGFRPPALHRPTEWRRPQHDHRPGARRYHQPQAAKDREVLEIPIHAALETSMQAGKSGQLALTSTQLGKPFSAKGFGNWVSDAARQAGLPADAAPTACAKPPPVAGPKPVAPPTRSPRLPATGRSRKSSATPARPTSASAPRRPCGRCKTQNQNGNLSNRPVELDKNQDKILKNNESFRRMAARKGLEPLTFALGKRCSILLSYRAALRAPGVHSASFRACEPRGGKAAPRDRQGE